METLAEFLRRNEHQALSILKESARTMGFTPAQWKYALEEYYHAP